MDRTGQDNNNHPAPKPAFNKMGNDTLRVLELRAETSRAINLLRSLRDASCGKPGEDLQTAFKKTGCVIDVDLEMGLRAVFNSFAYPPSKGKSSLTNTISLGKSAASHRSSMVSAIAHEQTHALHTARSAAYPHEPDYSGADPVPVDTFNALRDTAGGSSLLAMRTAALYMLPRPGFTSYSDKPVTLAESYHELALAGYTRLIKAHLRDSKQPLTFVRMEDEDILAIGQSHGPSLFGDGNLMHTFREPAKLSQKNQHLLDRLNKLLGIADENALPTLGEALAAKNMTRADMIAQSSRRPHITSKIPTQQQQQPDQGPQI